MSLLRMGFRSVELTLIWGILAQSLAAQQPSEPAAQGDGPPTAVRRATYIVNHDDLPVARAVRTEQEIVVDGNLNEAAWATAEPITEFWQYDPDTGLPFSEGLEVRFLYDDDALYVGVFNRDPKLAKRLLRRDGQTSDSDMFIIYLDTYHDHRTASRFLVNASGYRRDVAVAGGGVQGQASLAAGDASWDPVWEERVREVEDGWFIEERIPFSQLRFPAADEQFWGLQIERKSRPNTEEVVWSWTPSNQPGGVSRFGHLVGIKGIKPGKKLELLPYVSGRADYIGVPQNPAVAFSNPFVTGSEYSGTSGIDIKYRLGSNLTLDGTVNPDFGQVELDPAVINLTAFETRYDEHRPFFVEGSELFSFGNAGPTLFYSRRFGRAPQGRSPAAAAYSTSPETTTILGAAKLTGRPAEGWSIGIIDAVTARERSTWLGADRIENERDVEPQTNYFAGRVRRELRSGQTVLGMLTTAVNRTMAGSPMDSVLLSGAYAGGVDFRHQWARRVWELQSHVSTSYVTGSPAALIATQSASRRYLQRPDADHPGVDSTATSMGGYQARVAVAKQAGLWRMNVDALAISPGYEVNDLGFQTDAGRMSVEVGGGLQQTRTGRRLRNWSVTDSTGLMWNYSGDLIGLETALSTSAQLPNFHRISGRLAVRPELLDDRLTRGGPLARAPAGFSSSLRYTVDNRSVVSGGPGMTYRRDRSGAWDGTADVTVMWRMTTWLDGTLQPRLSRTYATAQYVSSPRDATAEQTFGRRYVFADLNQTTVSLTARLNATLTPDVTLELYAQPFLSSARYDRLKELRAARTFDFATYGVDAGTVTRTGSGGYVIDPDGVGPARSFQLSNQDFNVRSMRGNAVFRWEWRPGATLYLVWQQIRSGRLVPDSPDDQVGDFDLDRDANALFRIDPDNIFQVKVNYWLNL